MQRRALPRQIGRFVVHGNFFDRLYPDEGTNLFESMVVLDVKHDWHNNEREYLAVHPAFREVAVGELVPRYHAIFRHEHGATSLPEWQEVKPTKEYTREEILDGLRNVIERDHERARNRPQQVRAVTASDGHSGLVQQRQVEQPKLGWFDRLHRKLRQLLRLRVDPNVRDAAAGRGVPEGRQREHLGAVGLVQPRQEHHAHGDGVFGEDAVGYESAAPAAWVGSAAIPTTAIGSVGTAGANQQASSGTRHEGPR
jgi:hypothetical protein